MEGHDHPVNAYTMCGMKRLNSLHEMLLKIYAENVPGDLIECGVWRGGMCMFMAAFCAEYGLDKKIVVADSFCGLPEPTLSQDSNMTDHMHEHLRISRETVKDGFTKLGIPLDNVEFAEGWFKDTLPAFQGREWALVRADGDMYESTMDILTNLYPGLVNYGYMVIDDYGCVLPCRQAVHDYRDANGITDPIFDVDWTCKAWRRKD
jgi:O-methyltransferase